MKDRAPTPPGAAGGAVGSAPAEPHLARWRVAPIGTALLFSTSGAGMTFPSCW